MKHIKILMLTTVLFSESIFCKFSNQTNRPQQTSDRKMVRLEMFPAPTRDLLINVVDGSTLIEPNSVMFPKGKESLSIAIKKPYKNEKIEFYILPNSLHEYCKIPKNARRNYNPNAELPRSTGEERLTQALATSVSYDFDTLPKEIALPNPLEILHDLLNCNC